MALSLVFGRWREAVLGTSCLWSSIGISYGYVPAQPDRWVWPGFLPSLWNLRGTLPRHLVRFGFLISGERYAYLSDLALTDIPIVGAAQRPRVNSVLTSSLIRH
ncbi:hypothetical protein L218DRAFT_959880 [Marasmius fiardii PR-910]|nr:hypothetical protein L218DRAFT_959880 [Marasmius fiardii PR-910]